MSGATDPSEFFKQAQEATAVESLIELNVMHEAIAQYVENTAGWGVNLSEDQQNKLHAAERIMARIDAVFASLAE